MKFLYEKLVCNIFSFILGVLGPTIAILLLLSYQDLLLPNLLLLFAGVFCLYVILGIIGGVNMQYSDKIRWWHGIPFGPTPLCYVGKGIDVYNVAMRVYPMALLVCLFVIAYALHPWGWAIPPLWLITGVIRFRLINRRMKFHNAFACVLTGPFARSYYYAFIW